MKHLGHVQDVIGKMNCREIQGGGMAVRHYPEGFAAQPLCVGELFGAELVPKDHRNLEPVRTLGQDKKVARVAFKVSPAIADHGMDAPIFVAGGENLF